MNMGLVTMREHELFQYMHSQVVADYMKPVHNRFPGAGGSPKVPSRRGRLSGQLQSRVVRS